MRLIQVAVVLTAVTLAGCGAVRPAGTGPGGTPAARVRVSHPDGPPPWSTRAGALGLALRLIGGNVLPPGARRLPQRPVPEGLRQVLGPIGVTSMVDVYRLFALPVSVRQAATFLARHAPAGMHGGGIGQSGGPGGITEMDVSYFPDGLTRGISSASLIDTVVPAPRGGALLREDAQVIWYPRRSAAEHLDPGNYRAVIADAWFYSRGVRHVTRTFTSRGIIGRLARLPNSLPAFPGGPYSCPQESATYQLTFEGMAGQPDVVVRPGCASDAIWVGGARQPALADFGELAALAGKIMRAGPSRIGPSRKAPA